MWANDLIMVLLGLRQHLLDLRDVIFRLILTLRDLKSGLDPADVAVQAVVVLSDGGDLQNFVNAQARRRAILLPRQRIFKYAFKLQYLNLNQKRFWSFHPF